MCFSWTRKAPEKSCVFPVRKRNPMKNNQILSFFLLVWGERFGQKKNEVLIFLGGGLAHQWHSLSSPGFLLNRVFPRVKLNVSPPPPQTQTVYVWLCAAHTTQWHEKIRLRAHTNVFTVVDVQADASHLFSSRLPFVSPHDCSLHPPPLSLLGRHLTAIQSHSYCSVRSAQHKRSNARR